MKKTTISCFEIGSCKMTNASNAVKNGFSKIRTTLLVAVNFIAAAQHMWARDVPTTLISTYGSYTGVMPEKKDVLTGSSWPLIKT